MYTLPVLQLIALVTLFGWRHLPEPYLGWLLLPVWVLAGCLIFAGSIEAARLRRRAWLDQYLLAASPWHARLRGGWLMNGWHLLLSALLALFMLVKLLWLDPWLWLLLLVHMPLLWWLSVIVCWRLQGHVKPLLLDALSRRLLVPLGALLLLLGYVLVSLNLSQPNMLGRGWAEALGMHLQDSRSGQPLLAVSDRAHQLLELTVQWAMQNALGDADRSGLLGLLAWSLLLVSGSAFIWAWMRLLSGIGTLVSGWRSAAATEPAGTPAPTAALQERR